VRDAYDNALAGVTVLFAVSGGGGSLTGESVKTDASGIATVGSWRLGSAGTQILTATIAPLASLTFQAKAIHPVSSCAATHALPGTTIVQADLTAQTCQGYTIAISRGETYEFKLSSTAFDAQLELRDETGNEIAVSNARVNVTSPAMRVVLPAGAYTLLVSSLNADASGPFAVSYAPVDNSGGCDDAFIVRGVDFERTVTYTNCANVSGQQSLDRFRIRMTAGSRISAVLEDYSLADNRFDVQNEYGVTVATATVKNYVESDLEFTAPADGYYTLMVQVEYSYRLIVR
jgi:hypothetical protein